MLSGLFSTKRPIITTIKDIIFKVPIITILCFIIGFFPFGIAFLGMRLTKVFTGQECLNEGDCGWVAVPFLCMITIPIAAFLFLIFMIRVVREIRINIFEK
jgi:hypothetical protein